MKRLLKTTTLSLLFFILSILGSCLLYATPTSATWQDDAASLWDSQVPRYYKVFVKDGTKTVISNESTTPSSPNWVMKPFLPQITTNGTGCDSGNNVVAHDFNSVLTFNNCRGLSIQEHTGVNNDAWFQQANISYVIGDFDNSETIDIGRGKIVDHGASTIGNPNGTQNATAKVAPGVCDTPNPHYTTSCSLLIYFTRGDAGDFHIILDNTYPGSPPYHTSGHEYWYSGPKQKEYRTLTFDPNGGSVADTPADSDTLVSHMSGVNLLREYVYQSTANSFPTPVWPDGTYTFLGWFTAGGNQKISKSMDNDDTLYAHWARVAQWSVTPNITINTPTALPGQTVSWTHSVTNNGPDNTDKSVSYYWQNSGYLGTGTGGGGVISSGFVAGTTKPSPVSTSSHAVTQDDVNQNLCRSTVASPRAWNDNSAISVSACAFVPYNYTLIPGVGTDANNIIESGATVQVTPTVSNQAPPANPTRSANTPWQLTQLIIQPGVSVPNQSGGFSLLGTTPCSYFVGAGVTCSIINPGSSVFDVGGSVHSGDVLSANSVVVGDLATGSKICFAFSVQPRAYAMGVQDSRWAHSAPNCLVIGKKPKTQIWAGDLIVTGNVTTSTSTKAGNTYGSWAEYGIIASGGISGAASGAAFAGPTGNGSITSVCDYSKLSFTNTKLGYSSCDNTTAPGSYTNAANMPNVAASFPGTGNPISGSVAPSSLPSVADNTYNATDITLNQSDLPAGKTVVIKASGTVTINGDQTYSNGPYTSINQLPQLVIIANKIIINNGPSGVNGVHRVDAWLVATTPTGTGSIYTCDVQGTSTGVCDNKLVVNGPVMTNHLYLWRTYGSEAASMGEAAETFNLRADAYLWAMSHSTTKNYIQTVYNTELPPRL